MRSSPGLRAWPQRGPPNLDGSATRNLRHHRARLRRLSHNPRLLVGRPAPTPDRTRQNLKPPVTAALRVVVNAIHNVSPKLPAPGTTSTFTPRTERTAPKPRLRSIQPAGRSRCPLGQKCGMDRPTDLAVDLKGTSAAYCLMSSAAMLRPSSITCPGSTHIGLSSSTPSLSRE